MRHARLPKTDSIEELADFWNSHDLTDFEQDLEEVDEAVFVQAKRKMLGIQLQPAEVRRLKGAARTKKPQLASRKTRRG